MCGTHCACLLPLLQNFLWGSQLAQNMTNCKNWAKTAHWSTNFRRTIRNRKNRRKNLFSLLRCSSTHSLHLQSMVLWKFWVVFDVLLVGLSVVLVVMSSVSVMISVLISGGNIVCGVQGPQVSKVTLCVQILKWLSPTECRYRASRAVKNLILFKHIFWPEGLC